MLAVIKTDSNDLLSISMSRISVPCSFFDAAHEIHVKTNNSPVTLTIEAMRLALNQSPGTVL